MKTYRNISKNYVLKWQIIGSENYKVSECGKLINCKTDRIIKETVVNYTKGFWIGKRFIKSKTLNKYLEIIPSYKTPF